MPLTLYRRHLKACRVHKTKLSGRAKRFFQDCECPIWMYGRTDKIMVPRQSIGTSDMKVAEAKRAELIAGSKNETVHGLKLSECIKDYLESREHELSDKTHQQHTLLLQRLERYCKDHGVFFAGELTVDLLDRFVVKGLPGLANTSKATAVAKLRCFLRDAYRRDWIAAPLREKTNHTKRSTIRRNRIATTK